ncbi:acylphosphatase [Aestuariicella hydrocarbonica]|uniref:Acylphosphatase n=1 Tax=Pseudomaricurvus hydrocarbonicus TaxID=1470433 RepID=A0A9E5JT57_9GAMM|nr:acylphosphatase [Aestuariicella hydrocarbonica]
MLECQKGWVSGRVQGVGFRYFVQQCAQRAGLTGYARNLQDGRVEVLLQGPSVRVSQVKILVEQGPAGSSVSSVEWQLVTDTVLSRFTIG